MHMAVDAWLGFIYRDMTTSEALDAISDELHLFANVAFTLVARSTVPGWELHCTVHSVESYLPFPFGISTVGNGSQILFGGGGVGLARRNFCCLLRSFVRLNIAGVRLSASMNTSGSTQMRFLAHTLVAVFASGFPFEVYHCERLHNEAVFSHRLFRF